MTADAEAEGKVARRRGRLSRRRVSAHRARKHPEFRRQPRSPQHGERARRVAPIDPATRRAPDVISTGEISRNSRRALVPLPAGRAHRIFGARRATTRWRFATSACPNPQRLPRHALAPARGADAASTAHAEPRLVDRRGGVAAAAFASSASSDGRLSQVLVGDWHSAAFYYVPRLQPMRFR